jgi:ribulose 1,5-bisphosphate synthetase/thiazole synthase
MLCIKDSWPVMSILAATASFLAAVSSSSAATAATDYDVVVYGSTPAGIAAATAAARLGMRVALYEPLPMIGGMGAAGNLALHDGGAGSGLALEFCMLNAAYYNVTK